MEDPSFLLSWSPTTSCILKRRSFSVILLIKHLSFGTLTGVISIYSSPLLCLFSPFVYGEIATLQTFSLTAFRPRTYYETPRKITVRMTMT